MSRHFAISCITALSFAILLSASLTAHGQNQPWNQNQPTDQNQTPEGGVQWPGAQGQGTQSDNPLIGSWKAISPQKDGSSLVIFMEYAPNGHWRSTSIGQGGMIDGKRMQVWGTYQIRKVGQGRYELDGHADGYAPMRMCVQGGQCQKLSGPTDQKEFEEVRDANHIHVHAEGPSGIVDLMAERSPVPQQLQTIVPETIVMAAPPPAYNGGAAPVLPYNGGHVTPPNPIPGIGGNCDNAHQEQLCYINDHLMYTDSRGCRVCTP